jgi:hypothetical protein
MLDPGGLRGDDVGSISRNLTECCSAKGQKVPAVVRREDQRAEALRQLKAT